MEKAGLFINPDETLKRFLLSRQCVVTNRALRIPTDRRVVLLRHEEAWSNVLEVYQPDDDKLTVNGTLNLLPKVTALKVIPEDEQLVIYTSHLKRALQTTFQIAPYYPAAKIVVEPLLREKKPASDYVGLRHTAVEAERIHWLMERHKFNPRWHFSDEENYYDVIRRAKQFWKLRVSEDPRHILVVTHGVTAKALDTVYRYPDESEDKQVEIFHQLCWDPNINIENGSWRVLEDQR